jgi:hypothetical protein
LIRGVFDEEVRRKPLALAADAVSYGIGIDFGLEVVVFERSCARSPLLMLIDIMLTSLSMFTSS